MYCPSCGASIESGLASCPQCAFPLNSFVHPQETSQPMEKQPTEAFGEDKNKKPEAIPMPAPQYSQNAPAYNQAPPMYNQAPPMYNQYQNPPMYNQPGYAGYANPYEGTKRPRRNPGKVCGILSFIFSLVGYPFLICYGAGLFYWLAALILGSVGLSVSKRNGFKNGLAKAGIIITLLPLIAAVAIGVVCGGAYLIALLLQSMGLDI